jgi:hypothetical protein
LEEFGEHRGQGQVAALEDHARDVVWAMRAANIDVLKAGGHFFYTDDHGLALPLLDSLQHICLLCTEVVFSK